MGYIVWLASYPKSGNTWMRVFLRNLTHTSAPADINSVAEHFPYDVAARYYQAIDPRPLSEYTRADVLRMRGPVQRAIAASHPKVTLVKTHSALVIEDGFPLIDPNVTAGAIYLVRHPFDVAVSYSHHAGISLDHAIAWMNTPRSVVKGSERGVSEHFGSWSENVQSWTRSPSKSIHVVRYEDLVAEPVKTFSGVAAFLGLGADPVRIRQAIQRSEFRRLQQQETANGFIERPQNVQALFFRKGKIGEGQRALSEEQKGRIVAAHGDQMRRFGYLDADP